MICPQCKEDREHKDFYGKFLCYRCVYFNKINLPKQKKCSYCKNPYIAHNLRKFCSDKCASSSSKKKKQEYWTKKLA